jgi:hypothetical protein
MTTIPKALTDLGLKAPSLDIPRRIIASVVGHQKSGKTHTALTAPEPITYINIDESTEGVISKFGSKVIAEYKPVKPNLSAPQSAWVPVYDGIRKVVEGALAYNEGTLVIDTATELYRIHRMAKFGKLTQVMPHHYTEINTEFKAGIFFPCYESKMSVIFLLRYKKKYVNDNWSGGYEKDGYTAMEYDVQFNLETIGTDREGGGRDFAVRVVDSRHDASLVGLVFPDPNLPTDLKDKLGGFEFLLEQVHGKRSDG